MGARFQLASLGGFGSGAAGMTNGAIGGYSYGGGGGGGGGTPGAIQDYYMGGSGIINRYGGASTPMLKGQAQAHAKQAYDFLTKEKGLSHEAAVGVLANIQKESGFNPGARGDGGNAHGIFQHHADRRAAILRGTGINMSTAGFLDQLKGGVWEAESGSDRGAGQAWKILKTPGLGADQYAAAWSRLYERPGNTQGEMASRGRMANGMLGMFGPGAGAAGGVSGSGGISLAGVPVKSSEAVAGGGHAPALTALAQELTSGGVAGGLTRFTAFNDAWHVRNRPNSKHVDGLATDFTIKDPRYSAQAAEQIRQKFRAAGLTDDMFKVIDEYKTSTGGTGGHIHAQFNTVQAAKIYEEHVKRQRALAAEKAKAAQTSAAMSGRSTLMEDRLNGATAGASTAKSITKGIPTPPPRPAGGAVAGGGGGINAPITINGAGQNPEQIAAAVQRRISEAMNYRGHDVEHEFT
jgi:hypothetical protein